MYYMLYGNPAVKAGGKKSFPKKIAISKRDYSQITNVCFIF